MSRFTPYIPQYREGLALNRLFPTKTAFYLGKCNKNLLEASKTPVNTVIQAKIQSLKTEIQQGKGLIERFKQDSRNEKNLLSLFEPSKTSKNGLNFVSNKDIETFKKKEQPEMLVNLIKIIHFLAKEPLPEGNLVVNLLEVLMPNRQVETLKELFLGSIIKNLEFSQEEYALILKFHTENGKTMGPGLMKISRSLSYISFILKEIIEYVLGSFNEFEGTQVQEIRLKARELDKMQLTVYNLENNIVI